MLSRRGIAVAATSLAVAVAPATVASSAHASAPTPVDGYSASLSAAPETIVASAPTDKPLTVTAVKVTADGTPTVVSAAAATPADATVKIAALQRQPDVRAVAMASPLKSMASNDAYRPYQWAMDRLHFENVWPSTTAAGTIVAVVDTGVDPTQPDLVANLLPGVDVSNSPATMSDPLGHGTHIAGTIAAVANNGLGVAGAAPGAKILPVKVFEPDGTAWSNNVATGIMFAADQRANVINLSLGGTVDDAVLAYAIHYARSRGVAVVSAVGNDKDNGNPVYYPAAYPGVIGVGASDESDVRAAFSGTGAQVDVVAPGVLIASTYPGNQYVYMEGTSVATPFVSATLAMVRAAHPSWPTPAVEAAVLASATDLGTPGRDDDTGYGLVNPVAANSYLFPSRGAMLSPQGTVKIHTGAEGNSTVFGNLTVTQPQASSYVTAYPCDQARPVASNINFVAGQTVANYLAVKTDSNGDFCVYSPAATHVIFDETAATTAVTSAKAVRQVDTRELAYGARPVAAGAVLTVHTGAPGASTVFGNLTITEPQGGGYLTAYPCNEARPLASNLNFLPGATVANYLAVKTDSSGNFCVYTTATAHILFDKTIDTTVVAAATPVRKMDTRDSAYLTAQPGDGGVVRIHTTAAGSQTVFGNLTVTEPQGGGYLTAYPCGDTRPYASNVNYVPNKTVANYLAVKTDSNGDFCVYTTARAHIIFDETAVTSDIVSFPAARMLDTRETGPLP